MPNLTSGRPFSYGSKRSEIISLAITCCTQTPSVWGAKQGDILQLHSGCPGAVCLYKSATECQTRVLAAGGSLRADQAPCIQRQSSSAMCYTALPEYRDEDAATRGSRSGLQAADKNWKLSRLGALSPTSWLSSFASCRPPDAPCSHKAALAKSPV